MFNFLSKIFGEGPNPDNYTKTLLFQDGEGWVQVRFSYDKDGNLVKEWVEDIDSVIGNNQFTPRKSDKTPVFV